jgi:hypothetical protein
VVDKPDGVPFVLKRYVYKSNFEHSIDLTQLERWKA